MLKDLIQIEKNYYFKPVRPVMAVLYITSKCNLRCSFCEMGRSLPHTKKDMSTEELKDIVSQLNDWGVKKIYITGGEPFVRRDIWDILSFCEEKNIKVHRLTTNGTLLKRISDDKLQLLKNTVSSLCISLDSADPGLHDHIRGVDGTYERIIDFLESVPRGEVPLFLSAVLTNNNFKEIAGLIRLAHKYGISHVNFQPLNIESNFADLEVLQQKREMTLSAAGLDSIEAEAENGSSLARELGVSTNLKVLSVWIRDYFKYLDSDTYFFDKVLKNHVCSKPFNYIHINYYGELWGCTMLNSGVNIIGKDIKKAWQETAERYKSVLLRKKYFSFCHSCFCDFPTNLRESLIYHPIGNHNLLMKLTAYYSKRALLHA